MDAEIIEKKPNRNKVGRRYTAGDNKFYDDIYNRKRMDSHILNSGNRGLYNGIDTAGEQNMRATLYEYIGDEKGVMQDREGYNEPALIPALKQQLHGVYLKWEKYKKNRVKKGFKEPAEWPRELENERFRFEALVDIAEAEADWLRRHVQEIEKERSNEDARNVLKHGPECSCIGDPAREIDGQKVGHSGRVLIIDDKRSPYDGISLADYREMGKAWMKERSKKATEQRKAREEEIQKTGKSDIIVINNLRSVPKASLPPWPEGVKNYKK